MNGRCQTLMSNQLEGPPKDGKDLLTDVKCPAVATSPSSLAAFSTSGDQAGMSFLTSSSAEMGISAFSSRLTSATILFALLILSFRHAVE